jgi:hypothetical protein
MPRRQSSNNNNNTYVPPNNLEDFGLPHHGDEPLLEENAGEVGYGRGRGAYLAESGDNNNNQNEQYVFLRPFRLLPKRDGWGAVANLDLFFAVCVVYDRGFRRRSA